MPSASGTPCWPTKAPIEGIGQPEKVGLLLEYEAQKLSLVDVSQVSVVHTLQTDFRGPVVPAFALWDGELLTHSGLEVPPASSISITGVPNHALGQPPFENV